MATGGKGSSALKKTEELKPKKSSEEIPETTKETSSQEKNKK
jgi:hypothetical protein